MRRLGWYLAASIAILALGAGVLWLYAANLLAPAANHAVDRVVGIPRGANVPQIGRILETTGTVRSARAFYYYVLVNRLGPGIKAGEHVLNASLSTPEIVQRLIEGRFKLYRLTLPEGLTMTETAAAAARSGRADETEFMALCRDPEFIRSVGLDDENLEGYLFPDTYHFVRGTTTRQVVKALVDRFLQVWKRYEARAAERGMSRREVVTLASIIEKETGAREERPLIASVFLNRLRRGMRLETDPTVIYGIKDFNGNLTRKHLETPTPYNTYIISGLPPGPIANPGEESIRAVLYPAESEYLFFVSRNDGTHYFSRSLTEHNRAVWRYQKQGRR